MQENEYTSNTLLDGRVKIKQPLKGFRAAIDSVFLAASVNAKKGETVLDAGMGSGAASLCLGSRIPDISITGIEIQKDVAELANENIRLNGMENRIKCISGDIAKVPPELRDIQFSHVMSNPPFAASGSAPDDFSKAVAHIESSVDLSGWLDFCIRKIKPKGRLYLVHRADRLDEIMSLIHGRIGEITVIPLWPRDKKQAKRIILTGRKSSKTPMVMSAGITLHEGEGYTAETEKILRQGMSVTDVLKD